MYLPTPTLFCVLLLGEAHQLALDARHHLATIQFATARFSETFMCNSPAVSVLFGGTCNFTTILQALPIDMR